jgi:hypothetical protein
VDEFLTTDLRDYYDLLHGLSELEQTALAEAHAEDASYLLTRFERTVAVREQHPLDVHEEFHPGKRTDPRTRKPPTPEEIIRTIHYAGYLADQEHEVAEVPALRFSYLDNEIFPGRTKGEFRMEERTFDLLLASENRPVVGELKIKTDSLTYYALIQALMHAAELATASQVERLREHYDVGGESQVDVFLIAHEPVEEGKFRSRSLKASARITKQLCASPSFAERIARVAYVRSYPQGDGLRFEPVFAYEGKETLFESDDLELDT